MQIEEISTPAVLIDLDVLEKNIATMKRWLSGKKCGIRPHVKAHKSAFVAHKQLDSGALGVACQTIEEAEAVSLAGVDDILLTNMAVSQDKMRRVADISGHAEIAVTVDDPVNVGALALAAEKKKTGRKLGVVVEVDVGQNRTGVSPGKPALELVREVLKHQSLDFRGLMGYEGHLQCSIPNFEERSRKCREALSGLIETKNLVEDSHIPIEIVSAGGTGTYNIASEVKGVTEIQPGSYVTMDHRYRMIDTSGKDFGCSLSVIATVVSRPTKERAIIDLGWKSVGLEYQIFGWQGMPVPKNLGGGLEYSPGGDEHGVITLKGGAPDLKPGDRIEFIPSHCDTTLNLHGRFYGVRDGNVELVCASIRR